MNTAPHSPLLLTIAIGLVMSGLSLPANAQQPTQQQQQEARKEMQQEERNRRVEVIKRRISDDERAQGMTERNQWLEQRKRTPVIGVLLSPDEHPGANIAGVTPGSAATMASLQAGDRIISIDGHRTGERTGCRVVTSSRAWMAGRWIRRARSWTSCATSRRMRASQWVICAIAKLAGPMSLFPK